MVHSSMRQEVCSILAFHKNTTVNRDWAGKLGKINYYFEEMWEMLWRVEGSEKWNIPGNGGTIKKDWHFKKHLNFEISLLTLMEFFHNEELQNRKGTTDTLKLS